MTDEQFVKTFERGELSPDQFRHADHLRLAWYYSTILSFEEAASKVAKGIKQFAIQNNAGTLYHETVTMFWVSEIYRAIKLYPAASFAEFANKNPWLRDKYYINGFYSESVLKSDRAKREWIKPDLTNGIATAAR